MLVIRSSLVVRRHLPDERARLRLPHHQFTYSLRLLHPFSSQTPFDLSSITKYCPAFCCSDTFHHHEDPPLWPPPDQLLLNAPWPPTDLVRRLLPFNQSATSSCPNYWIITPPSLPYPCPPNQKCKRLKPIPYFLAVCLALPRSQIMRPPLS